MDSISLLRVILFWMLFLDLSEQAFSWSVATDKFLVYPSSTDIVSVYPSSRRIRCGSRYLPLSNVYMHMSKRAHPFYSFRRRAQSLSSKMNAGNPESPKDNVGKNMEHLFAANAMWADEMKRRDPVSSFCFDLLSNESPLG